MLGLINGEVASVSSASTFDLPFDIRAPEVVAAALAVAQPGGTVITDVDTAGTQLRMIVASVEIAGVDARTTFVVAIDIGTQRRAIYQSMLTYAALSVGALLVAAIAGQLLTRRLMRPLAELRVATREIDSDDLARRVTVREPDNDVAELAVNFNRCSAGWRRASPTNGSSSTTPPTNCGRR